MTPAEKAAFVTAQTAMMLAVTELMKAEDRERERAGYAPANGPKQWEEHIEKWQPVLGYNSLLQFFNE